MGKAIVWFRSDLRLADNPALTAALHDGHVPLPVYIHCPGDEGNWSPGAASNAWLAKSLASLSADLEQRGSRLLILRGNPLEQLQQLIRHTGAEAVYWNRRYEPMVVVRDAHIKQTLRQAGLTVRSFNSHLLSEPWQHLTGQGTPYKVFTPFWKALAPVLSLPSSHPAPTQLPPPELQSFAGAVSIDALALAPSLAWDAGFWDLHSPGESGARDTLQTFIEGSLHGYAGQRDLPDRVGTSLLSAHLRFGEIAPWTVIHTLRAHRTAANAADVDAIIRQLGWRDFAWYTLHHFPHSAEQDLNPRFSRMDWATADAPFLAQWQQGHTGIPIVDAGMRQLWHTGWMHNRVRMIVGSWLTKHMRLHWSHGARWFWDTLVDADLANNTLGWQWVAGTGVDAAPYFRIFNPVTQAQKFDPDARYISQWVPELRSLPVKHRFAPWLHGRVAGYPEKPHVGLSEGREAALSAWKASS